ncbi:hypothetical protein LNP74_18485 [Klebsiella pneumoniae subsp. pneumoniae]|nr:hypothetical protein [Klebsiella pneumoniae subsp. pneumoniae]
MLNRVRFRRKSKIPSILTGFSLDSSPKEGYFLDLRHGFVNYHRKSATIHPVFLTLAGSVESAGKSRQAERLVTPITLIFLQRNTKKIQNINKSAKKKSRQAGKPTPEALFGHLHSVTSFCDLC